jgi:hypothetical protein
LASSNVVETVAQLVEHGTFNAGVAGSSPAGLIFDPAILIDHRPDPGCSWIMGDFALPDRYKSALVGKIQGSSQFAPSWGESTPNDLHRLLPAKDRRVSDRRSEEPLLNRAAKPAIPPTQPASPAGEPGNLLHHPSVTNGGRAHTHLPAKPPPRSPFHPQPPLSCRPHTPPTRVRGCRR